MTIIYGSVKGVKRVQYTNKAGKEISGYEYHFTYEADDINGDGCASVYVSDFDIKKVSVVPGVGDDITVAYDPFRRSMSFLPV